MVGVRGRFQPLRGDVENVLVAHGCAGLMMRAKKTHWVRVVLDLLGEIGQVSGCGGESEGADVRVWLTGGLERGCGDECSEGR